MSGFVLKLNHIFRKGQNQKSDQYLKSYFSKILGKQFLLFCLIVLSGSVLASLPSMPGYPQTVPDQDTIEEGPEIELPYNFNDQGGYLLEDKEESGLFLNDPSNVREEIEFDPETNQYLFTRKIGDLDYRNPASLTFDEYQDYQLDKMIKSYWREKAKTSSSLERDGIIPSIYVGGEVFDRIFGSNTIDIRPNGSAELTFGILGVTRDDPTLDVRQRRNVNFDFEENIQMNVSAKIGDKIQFNTNFNTEAIFDFENKLKLNYEGKEDEIIKLIEAGNVSMPLNTTLIRGTQSLFGIKTKLQFGKTTVTGLFSQQESETANVTVKDGAQTQEFLLKATDYDENRHFFLGHQFRDQYDVALSELPIINSSVNITKIEIWVTNIGPAVQENRNVIAFQDLGEPVEIYNPYIHPNPGYVYPTNKANDLMDQLDVSRLRSFSNVNSYLSDDPFGIGSSGYLVSGVDYSKIGSARKLDPSEFSLNSKLGFISILTSLNDDQALAVAYQYNVIGIDSLFQVGEFSDQLANTNETIVVKLLKSKTLSTKVPMWDLMMKNVYSIGAFRVDRTNFILNILYSGNENGIPTGYFTQGPEEITGMPLIEFFNFDNLDQQLNPPGDGVFDFIDNASTQGGTFQSSNGRLYFTVVEPFGKEYIKGVYGPEYEEIAEHYAFDTLYRTTKVLAQQETNKDRYMIEGFYQSESGSEIQLPGAINIPRGSVKVTAGGRILQENVDYLVDYTLGRVRIINEGILNSGVPINISTENQSLFSVMNKRLMGLNFDHQFNKEFRFGGTIMNLHERPLTEKVDYGNDPISNTIWGLDFSYQTESRFITKLVDYLPGIDTKNPSKVNIEGEFAHFIPGHSKAISKTGIVYIDDFEGAKSTIDLKNVGTWFMASTPQGQNDIFPEANTYSLAYGFNRAKLAWYIIDPLFYDRNNTVRPANVTDDDVSKNTVREVQETELFPEKDNPNGIPTNIPVFNMAFYPREKGPYNFDDLGSPFSSGVDDTDVTGDNIYLKDPESRWGGIMRRIESSDFETTNVEFVEFWLMDPFNEDANPDNPGKLYINLGDISEDILRDSRMGFENGLPPDGGEENIETTIWGKVSTLQNLVESFDNNEEARPFQDVGYDGLRSDEEFLFFNDYLQNIEDIYAGNPNILALVQNDASTDNYNYFRSTEYDNDPKYSDVLERYKKFNGPDGNSPSDLQNQEAYPTAQTTIPNVEDINRDNTLEESERYFQYEITLDPDEMFEGMNFITDSREVSIRAINGDVKNVTWYQFRVPISRPDRVVGGINNFKSIRFIRMFMREFEQPVVLRFATLELVRMEWRKFRGDLLAPGEYIPNDIQSRTSFDIFAINIEENGSRYPINYMLPPGVERESQITTTTFYRINEQSMVLKVCDLVDGDSRAAYKTSDFDFRQYEKLEMYVHAEWVHEQDNAIYGGTNGQAKAFIRVGSDFTLNYYEYEIPLTFTKWGDNFPDAVWPAENKFEIDLEKLAQVKLNRDVLARDPNSGVELTFPYVEYDDKNDGNSKITVVGVPVLNDVTSIMIGIRNPKPQQVPGWEDDVGNVEYLCAEFWVNELRLAGFNDASGWAAIGRVSSDLGDLGRVVFTASHSSPNFGTLEMKINETQRDAVTQFDIATDLELGKFFPDQSGVRIPFHFDYSQISQIPEYNPLNPDIKLKDELDTYEQKPSIDSVKSVVQDYTQRRSINFVNVRKDRVGSKRKPRVYDIENFTASYAYTNIYHRNIDIEYDSKTTHLGSFGYAFSTSPKNVKPFQNVGSISNSNALKLIGDFNFYYLPKSFSFRTDMNREYNEMKLRNISKGDLIIKPTFMKRWDWNRNYDLKLDLATSLSIEYRAIANAFIYEPPGSTNSSSPWYDTDGHDTISRKDEFFSGGTLRKYRQTLNVRYKIPIDKFPGLDWITSQFTYGSTYDWTASPVSIQPRIGNVIQNAQDLQLNGNFDFVKLYNKIGYLNKLNQASQPIGRGGGRQGRGQPQQQQQDEPEEADSLKKSQVFKKILEGTVKLLTMVKRASFSYAQSSGTVFPGFMPEPTFLGIDMPQKAPGLGFVFGSQKDIRQTAGENNWVTRDSILNQAYMRKYTDRFSAKASLEPFRGFTIELDANRTYSLNHSEFYRYADSTGRFESYSPVDAGTFSISYIAWGTAFGRDYNKLESDIFERMKDFRTTIADRLATDNPNSVNTVFDSITGKYWPVGYGPTSQDVIVPSFLAAYTNQSPNTVSTDYFLKIPLPNWTITYSGLTEFGFLANILQSATIKHAYRATYALSSYKTNLLYDEYGTGHAARLYNNTNSFVPVHDVAQITLVEQFAPLIGLDLTWNNSLTTRLEYRKTRTITFSMANLQLTDINSDEYIVGVGYRIRDVAFSVKSLSGGGKKNFSSDLDIQADFSLRNNRTVLRRLDIDQDQVSAGMKVISINTTIDYQFSRSLSMSLFFDKIINNPYVSNQYRNSTTRGGIKLRFSLAQ